MDTQAKTIQERIRQLAFRLEEELNEDIFLEVQYYGDPGKSKRYIETLFVLNFPNTFGYSLSELKEFGNRGGFDILGFEYTNLDGVFRVEGWVKPDLQICIDVSSIDTDRGRARVKQPVGWEVQTQGDTSGEALAPPHYAYPKPVAELEKLWRKLFREAYPIIKLERCFPYIVEGRVLFAATGCGNYAYHYTQCGTDTKLKGHRGTSITGLHFGLSEEEAVLLFLRKIPVSDIPLCWGHTNLFGDERGYLLAYGSGKGLTQSSPRTLNELDTILALARFDLYPATEVLEPTFRKWFRDKGKRFCEGLEN